MQVDGVPSPVDLDGLADFHTDELRLANTSTRQCDEAALQAHLLFIGLLVEFHLRVAEDVALITL